MFSDDQITAARSLLESYRRRSETLATAESCTGGLLAACLTEIAGSSDVFERGFVTYSNEAKMELLGVPRALLEAVGAVSAEVAEAMAAGAIAASRADIALSITGVAGPGGGSADKPVGLVFIGSCRRGAPPQSARHHFAGDRAEVRKATLAAGLARLAAMSDDTAQP